MLNPDANISHTQEIHNMLHTKQFVDLFVQLAFERSWDGGKIYEFTLYRITLPEGYSLFKDIRSSLQISKNRTVLFSKNSQNFVYKHSILW